MCLCVSYSMFLGLFVCFCHIPGPTMCISLFKVFQWFWTYVLHCVFNFQWFSVFSPYSRSYSVHFSFFMFFSVFCHIPHQTVFVSHFPRFFSFLAKIQVTQCVFLIFHVFHYFLPYSRSYSVWFSFCTFYSVSRYNPGPIECISHISQFSVCLAIFQVLQCAFLILHVFQCFSLYFMFFYVSFSFSSFVSFLTIF
jgi:hypothetical protein